MIPRVIHQVWLGESGGPEPPLAFRQAAATWRDHHPEWEYRLWGASEVERLFESVRPDLLALYRAYPYWVQRADAARYLILLEVGGVYADLDMVCTGTFEEMTDADVVLAPTKPTGVSNGLMAASPHHPLFHELVDQLPSSFRRWQKPWIPRHFRIMCGTGSLHLTRVFDGGTAKVRLLTEEEFGHGSPRGALIRHIEGNTWAEWDTHALMFLQRWWPALVCAGLVLSVLGYIAT